MLPITSRPTLKGWKQSTSFSGSMALSTAPHPGARAGAAAPGSRPPPASRFSRAISSSSVCLGGLGGQLVLKADKAALGAVLFLPGDIHPGSRIVSHQDHRQTWSAGEGTSSCCRPGLYLGGQSLSINADRHASPLLRLFRKLGSGRFRYGGLFRLRHCLRAVQSRPPQAHHPAGSSRGGSRPRQPG